MRILIAEDDDIIADGVSRSLGQAGYSVDWAAHGEAAEEALLAHSYDLLVLDLGLPRLSGLEVLKRLRARHSTIPVLILTALDGTHDRVRGLDLGADDYMVKPFELAELVARIRALSVRRSGQTSRLQVDDLVMELTTRKVSRAGQELHLSPICWALLEHLMRASPEPVPRERLESKIWGDEPPDSNTLKVHMHRLRKAVDKPFGRPLIHTLAGVGIQVKPHA